MTDFTIHAPSMTGLRHALRQFAKAPAFTTIAVLSLAIGIGVNSTIFSALDAAFLRPLPFKDADQIVRFEWPAFSCAEYQELRGQLQSCGQLVAVRKAGGLLRGAEGAEMVSASIVSRNYFASIGVGSATGRVFSEDDQLAPTEPVVVISHALWQRRFAGDPGIVGQSITLNGQSFTVLGVSAKGFAGDRRIPPCDIWYPVEISPEVLARRQREFDLIGRLRPGFTAAQVQAETEAILARSDWNMPVSPVGDHATVWTEREATMDHGGRLTYLAMPLVGLVLLVACANVSGLLLARYEERRREMAVRIALGGRRAQLVRQLLLESLLLALAGAGVGLLLTSWATRVVPAIVPPAMITLTPELHVDGRVLALTIALSAIATAVFGLLPAWRATRADVGLLLQAGAGPLTGGARWVNGRHVLVVCQLAISLVFLVGAGLFVRGFARGGQSDLGFTEKSILLVSFAPEMCGLTRAQSLAYSIELQERVRAIPGVRSVSAAARAPLSLNGQGATVRVLLPGDVAEGESPGRRVKFNSIEPGYLDTLGISIRQGRDFTARDDGTSARVAIISEATARQFFPGQDPVGKTIRVVGGQLTACEIVGVVRDVAISGPGEAPTPYLYVPLRQMPRGDVTLLAATHIDPTAVAALVREEMRRLDSRVFPISTESMGTLMRFALLPQWIGAWLGGVLGALAAVLALSGLYGSISHSVTRRTREIGVRMALGAQGSETLMLVLRQGLGLALAGVTLGLPAAVGLGFIMRRTLLGISPADPAVLAGASLLVIVVALAACIGPARRATRVDPLIALRAE
jgi:predicted permease